MIKNLTKNIDKKEDKYIEKFIDYLFPREDISFIGIKEDPKVKSPDYYVVEKELLVEIKEIHDREANKQLAQWSTIANKLQSAINSSALLPKVKGTYLIDTPPILRSPTEKEKFQEAAEKILQDIIAGRESLHVFNNTFTTKKVSDEGSLVVFGSSGPAGSYDASQIMHQNIYQKVSTADIQLSFIDKNYVTQKRVLLLVNKLPLLHWDWDVFKALSYMYSDLLAYENIDEIWLQKDKVDGTPLHKLIYRKSFFDQFEKGEINTFDTSDQRLFANWFSALKDLRKDEQLLLALRVFLKDKKPDEMFSDPITRMDMVRFGLWLGENKHLNDTVWFIEKFITDNNPPEPSKDNINSKDLYHHNQILNNKPDVNTITTVLGHLAWVIQKLALHKDYLLQAFVFTQELLKHKNLYVKLQALVPLIEITRRRGWLREINPKKYEEFHNLIFALLDECSQYKAIAKWLAQIFYNYKDLTTDEALEVVNKLQAEPESAAILIYFALFRIRHFKENGIFDSKPLVDKLIEIIKGTTDLDFQLKGSISWNFWRLLKDSPEEFSTVKPYIDLFVDQPYRLKAQTDTFYIIEDWIDREPDICTVWFEKYVQKITDFVKKDEGVGREIWFDSTKPILYLAKSNSNKIIPLVKNLTYLWESGAYIGNPKSIFESYKQIADKSLREEAKDEFKKMYSFLTTLNPKIEKVHWD